MGRDERRSARERGSGGRERDQRLSKGVNTFRPTDEVHSDVPKSPRCTMPRRCLLASLTLALTLALGTAADWPQFRGPTVSGVSAEKGLPTKWSAKDGIAWKTEMPGPGSSSPVFIGDRIFITCYTG